jgi:prepilin-type N-terminal cleavage/methylation domain-containing protein
MKKGFTLLEVLIVSVLLFALAITLFQTVKSTVTAKEDIDGRTEILQGARAAVSLIDRDLRTSYLTSPDDFGWDPKPPTDWPTGQPWAPPPPPLPITIFQGRAGEVFFTARTHQRTTSDAPENESHFVTYQLKGSQLVRGESTRAVSLYDREDPKRFKDFVLLDEVKRFDLKFWDRKSEKWLDSWDTDTPEFANRLPTAVDIAIEYMPDVADTARRKVESVTLRTSVLISEDAFRESAQPPPRSQVPTAESSPEGVTANP